MIDHGAIDEAGQAAASPGYAEGQWEQSSYNGTLSRRTASGSDEMIIVFNLSMQQPARAMNA